MASTMNWDELVRPFAACGVSAPSVPPSLPNEIWVNILAYLVEDRVDLVDCLWNTEKQEVQLHPAIFRMRMVSIRFCNMVDVVLARQPPTDIFLHGSIMADDRMHMEKMFRQYQIKLQQSLLPALRKAKPAPHHLTVHFAPDLRRMDAWKQWCEAVHFQKCAGIAQMTLTNHTAAALMLSAILKELVWSDDPLRTLQIRLVFHEQDGSTLTRAQFAPGQQRVETTAKPFWELNVVRYVLAYWNWIDTSRMGHSAPLADYVTLPIVAWPTPSRPAINYVFSRTERSLREAWRSGVEGLSEYPVSSRSHIRSVRIPGFARSLALPKSHQFTIWLTTVCRAGVSLDVYVSLGLGMLAVTDDRREAILIERPGGLAFTMDL